MAEANSKKRKTLDDDSEHKTKEAKPSEERIVIQHNTSCHRYIFKPPLFLNSEVTTEHLMKVQPYVNVIPEDIARAILQDHKESGDRFGFWFDTFPDYKVSREFLCESIIGVGDRCPALFTTRTAPFQGYTLEQWMPATPRCHGCVPWEYQPKLKPLRMTAMYALKFVEYLLQSLRILVDKGIHHNDLGTANILLNPTKEEIEQGVLRTTMPRLIDFHMSTLPPHPIKEHGTVWDFASLFATCRHNMQRAERKAHGDPEDEPDFLSVFVLDEERDYIKEFLQFLRDLQFNHHSHTLDSLLKMTRDTIAKFDRA